MILRLREHKRILQFNFFERSKIWLETILKVIFCSTIDSKHSKEIAQVSHVSVFSISQGKKVSGKKQSNGLESIIESSNKIAIEVFKSLLN